MEKLEKKANLKGNLNNNLNSNNNDIVLNNKNINKNNGNVKQVNTNNKNINANNKKVNNNKNSDIDKIKNNNTNNIQKKNTYNNIKNTHSNNSNVSNSNQGKTNKIKQTNNLNNNINKRNKMIQKENEDIVVSKNKSDTIKINNTKLDQETKVYNFKNEIKEQKNKIIQDNTNKNENVVIHENYREKNNLNKVNNNSEIIKEAQKIVKDANELEKEKNKNIKDKSNKQKKNKGLKFLLIIMIIALMLVIISTIFGVLNINNKKIIQGVYINNIDVSNLTKEEAVNKIENELNNNENNYITLNYDGITKKIYLSDIEGKFDVENAVEVAYNTARDNNLIHNNYKILQTYILKNNLDIAFSYNEELLQNQIDLISLDLPGVVMDSSYVIDGNNLIIKNSKDGIRIKKDEFTNSLINSFKTNDKTFEIPVEQCERKEVDIEAIHTEIYKEAKNATYTTNPYQIFKEENGLDFSITVDEAKNMLLEDKEEYVIPLKILKPKITVAKLDSAAFPNVLGTFTTTYGTGDVNRNANIALAAKSINSVVLMPGEVFSYNKLIGECSTRTGYKESTIYLNGELAKGVGGGICQVSTTLYNSVLRANLEIVKRRNHSLSVTYVPLGHDAMVSIGSQDFQFKNNRNYPIKVVATTGPGTITCKILGLKQDTEYDVKLYSRVISDTETKTKVETYKLLYLNGKEVSRTWLSTDTYKKH